MLVFQFISGFSIGLEYAEREDVGFLVNCDLGFFRLTWYRDVHLDDEDEEEQ